MHGADRLAIRRKVWRACPNPSEGPQRPPLDLEFNQNDAVAFVVEIAPANLPPHRIIEAGVNLRWVCGQRCRLLAIGIAPPPLIAILWAFGAVVNNAIRNDLIGFAIQDEFVILVDARDAPITRPVDKTCRRGEAQPDLRKCVVWLDVSYCTER